MKSIESDVANGAREYTKGMMGATDFFDFIDEMLQKNYSPMCEYVSPESMTTISLEDNKMIWKSDTQEVSYYLLPTSDQYDKDMNMR